MPKVKKIRAPALVSQQARHEPLGQVIEGDALRGKYAAPMRGRRKLRKNEEGEDEFLDDKTSKRILDMTGEQELEMEAEERREWQLKHQQQNKPATFDSDEEEEEEIEEVFIDEVDE
jgi:hypothetical protein